MHLVVHHMTEFDHIDDANSCGLVKPVSGATVPEVGLTEAGNACLVSVSTDLVYGCTVEDRSGELQAKFTAGPTEHGLINLTQVHT